MSIAKWIILIGLLVLPLSALANESNILEQSDSPVAITSHESRYQEEDDSRYSMHPARIVHDLKYKNTTDKEIVAVKFGLVEFDAFNEFLDKFTGFTVEKLPAAKEKAGTWVNNAYRAFTFDKYGTGVAYVSAVRFADGTIWRADLDKVLEQLRKLESSLKKEDLEEKKGDQK